MSKKIVFFVFSLLFISCQQKSVKYQGKDIILTPAYSYFQIFKRVEILDRFPDGIFYGGIQFKDQSGKMIKDNQLVKSVKIYAPNGSLIQEIEKEEYAPYSPIKASGYQKFTIHGYARWAFYNTRFNNKNPIPTGKYTIEVESISGHKTKTIKVFRGGGDPIKGFPKEIKFDQKSRKVTWKGTQGQTGYWVLFYQQSKEENKAADIEKQVFIPKDKITKTEYVLPKHIKLKKGETYTILVAAHNSDDFTLERMDYVHIQDSAGEIFIFDAK